jgi:hypothetical protein
LYILHAGLDVDLQTNPRYGNAEALHKVDWSGDFPKPLNLLDKKYGGMASRDPLTIVVCTSRTLADLILRLLILEDRP